MTIKTIKDVDEETWYRFKNLAVKNRVGMGILLNKMVKEYELRSEDFWKQILEGDKILTDAEAEDLLKYTNKLRKEHGFRK